MRPEHVAEIQAGFSTRLSNRDDESGDELSKRLRPSGKGWGPIPKGRRGGYRKPDGRGGWDYWYPEQATGQEELFAPRVEPKRRASHAAVRGRISKYREYLGHEAPRLQAQEVVFDIWTSPSGGLGNYGLVSSGDRQRARKAAKEVVPLYLLAEKHVAVSDEIVTAPGKPRAYWADLLTFYVSGGEDWDREHVTEPLSTPAEYAEARAARMDALQGATTYEELYARMRANWASFPEAYWRSGVVSRRPEANETAAALALRDLDDMIEKKEEFFRNALPEAEHAGEVQRILASGRRKAEERRLYAKMWRSSVAFVQEYSNPRAGAHQTIAATLIERMRDKVRAKEKSSNQVLGHWGSSNSNNPVAKTTALFGDHGRMRPLDRNMEPYGVHVFTGFDSGDPLAVLAREQVGPKPWGATGRVGSGKVQITEDNWGDGARRYLYAQKKIEKTSRKKWPTMYRGMGLPVAALERLQEGDRIPMTGCTALAFNRETAAHYAESSWTQQRSKADAVGVILEIERTDEFDASVAGWHPDKGRSGSPAFEVVSGINAVEVTQIIPSRSHARLAYETSRVGTVGVQDQRSEGGWPHSQRHRDTGWDEDLDLLAGGKRAFGRVSMLEQSAGLENLARREWLAKLTENLRRAPSGVTVESMRESRGPKWAAKFDLMQTVATPLDMARSAADHLAVGRLELGWLFADDDPRALVRMTEEEASAKLYPPGEKEGGYWRLEGGGIQGAGTGRPGPLQHQWPEGHVFQGGQLRDMLIRAFPKGPTIIRGRGVLDDPDEA